MRLSAVNSNNISSHNWLFILLAKNTFSLLKKVPALFFLLFLAFSVHSNEILTDLESEVTYSDEQDEVTKTEMALKLEWSHQFENEVDIKVIPKLLLDYDDSLNGQDSDNEKRASNFSDYNGPAYEDGNHRLELFESYIDMWFGDTSLRLGKQQVVWGQADGLKVLDVVNPQSYREFNLPVFEDSRIPTWMMNLQHPTGDDSNLQFLLIPDMTFNELADGGSDFQTTSPELAPSPTPGVPVQFNDVERPVDGELEFGIRWSAFIDGWDITANYFNFHQDNAVIYRDFNGGLVEVTPTYERSQLGGFTGSTAFSDWVVKIEAGYIQDNYFIRGDLESSGIEKSDEVASVFAFDYQGISDLMVSYQFFFSQVQNYEPEIVRKENSIRHTLLFIKDAWNETLELRLFALVNRDYDDGQTRGKVTYKVDDYWSVWTGVDYFYGDREGPFGQYSDASRVVAGWQFSY